MNYWKLRISNLSPRKKQLTALRFVSMTNNGSAKDSSAKSKQAKKPGAKGQKTSPSKIPNDAYEAEIFRLQTEFVKLQQWGKFSGARVVVIFEGREGAG